MRSKGFTLIELVVVMALIAVLAAIGVGAITVARQTAKYTEVKSEMRDIRTAMEVYIGKYGQLPPLGDFCSACADPPYSFNTPINAMRDTGIINAATATEWYTDPWGTPYAYDDNFGQVNSTNSGFFSAGPDGRKGSAASDVDGYGAGDDYNASIKHEGLTLW